MHVLGHVSNKSNSDFRGPVALGNPCQCQEYSVGQLSGSRTHVRRVRTWHPRQPSPPQHVHHPTLLAASRRVLDTLAACCATAGFAADAPRRPSAAADAALWICTSSCQSPCCSPYRASHRPEGDDTATLSAVACEFATVCVEVLQGGGG